MQCKFCGASNHEGAKFCGSCGRRLESEAAAAPVLTGVSENAALAMPITEKTVYEDGYFFKGLGFFKKLGIYALGVLLTFIVAAIVFAHFSPDYFSKLISYLLRFLYWQQKRLSFRKALFIFN